MAKTPKDAPRRLTPRQENFVREYLIDLNATAAARRAGYSVKSANEQGPRLLVNVGIQQAIQAERSKTTKKLDLSRERIAAELAKIAFADVREFGEWNADGHANLKPSEELTPEQTGAVSEITITHTGPDSRLAKLKLHSKIAAITELNKMLGFSVERRELTGPGGGPLAVAVDLSGLSDEQLRAAEAIAALIAPVATDAE